MYLETMERLFGGTDKIILDSGGAGSGVVPYLPLDELVAAAHAGSARSRRREAPDETQSRRRRSRRTHHRRR